MNQRILVSVVTPSYNQGEFLGDTIDSVLRQDYENIEYLVIDGSSTDGSVDIIEKYAERLAYWESQPDRGQAHAVNKGLALASGEILGWLNSDDILLVDTISRVVKTFEAHPEIDVVYGRLERINSKGDVIPTPELPKDRETFNKSLVVGECIVNQPGCYWRRSIMDEVGLLREDLQYSLDYEYWIRMALAGAVFYRLTAPVARFRLSSGSKTVGQTEKMAEEQLSVLDEILATPNLPGLVGLHPDKVAQQAKRARADIQLHAFYGAIKMRQWRAAFEWLRRSLKKDPSAIFQRRWLDLAIASVTRRFSTRH
jgi:glycosyltransferase involved in cell wall biosynthesis